MNTNDKFRVSLSWEAHQMAQQCRQGQFDAKRAKQVYLNTLGVYAVNVYLQCMGFETHELESDRCDPVMRAFTDVADLEVKQIGRLECRPVLPNENSVRVPPEVWHNRMGYFAVQLDQSLREATLLGFVKQVSQEHIPLSQWRSLDSFLQYASQLEQSVKLTQVKLSQWLNQVFETGWETVETLLSPPQMAWRSGQMDLMSPSSTISPQGAIERIKLLNLEQLSDPLALLVRVTPKLDPEMGIGVEVYPTGNSSYLPQELKLMVLDEEGAAVMQAEARSTKNIQLRFSGEFGEGFSIKVALGETSLTEAFLI